MLEFFFSVSCGLRVPELGSVVAGSAAMNGFYSGSLQVLYTRLEPLLGDILLYFLKLNDSGLDKSATLLYWKSRPGDRWSLSVGRTVFDPYRLTPVAEVLTSFFSL